MICKVFSKRMMMVLIVVLVCGAVAFWLGGARSDTTVAAGLNNSSSETSVANAPATRQVTTDNISSIFVKAYDYAMATSSYQENHVKVMLNEIIPQGIVPLVDPSVPPSADAYEVFEAGIGFCKEVTVRFSSIGATNYKIEALYMERFLDRIISLTKQANQAIATGNITPLGTTIRIPSVHFAWQQNPWAYSTPGPTEQVVKEIPTWAAVAIVRETGGLEVRVTQDDIYWDPCLYWRYGIRPPLVMWQVRMVPVEYVKTISLVNKYDSGTESPTVETTVDIQVIEDEEFRYLWH